MNTEKLNSFLKNVIIFLAVFLVINYFTQGCMQEQTKVNDGNLIFETTKDDYSKVQKVTLEIRNNTNETIVIPDECPNEPFNVFRYENNEWVQKTSTPELDCANTKDLIIEPGDSLQIPYDNWNNALFSEMGRFRVEFTTTLENEEKTITTNEFLIVKEGLFKQLWIGVFYRPIYNGLIYLASVVPGNSLGLAIILLTILIRTILLLPSHKAMASQRRMQELQPRLEKIKEKHKGDQQKIAMETMALWKEADVKPWGSCMPLLLQFPFLIAIFYVIKDGLNPDNAFLLYGEYKDFSLHDINVNFLWLNLKETNIYVLPLIIGALQFVQMKLSMAISSKKKTTEKKPKKGGGNEMAKAQSMMIYIMPVMIAVFTASLPAGVGIYWGTSTIYGIAQQIVINKGKTTISSEPKVRVIESDEKK